MLAVGADVTGYVILKTAMPWRLSVAGVKFNLCVPV
jgi:hypothetical protein